MTYIVCVCNACGKTFIFVLFTIAPIKTYVKCPHCESVDVQEIDIRGGSWEADEKKVENPRLPLMLLEYPETLSCIKLAKIVDKHIEKYDSLPLYIKVSKEIYDRYANMMLWSLYPDIRGKSAFCYREKLIEVRISE